VLNFTITSYIATWIALKALVEMQKASIFTLALVMSSEFVNIQSLDYEICESLTILKNIHRNKPEVC
jgi:hypothetical protein